ncbi:hypothetical protein [Lentzea sp. NPDC055074]
MSITVSVAPQTSGGLAALAAKHLVDTASEPAAKDRGNGRTTISNKLVGPVSGTVFQIGTVHNMNMPEGR